MLLALSLVGCAVSKNPNPMIRYGANTGATLAGPGFVVGAVLGGTVGFFKWMFNGFENDDIPREEPLPEEILSPAKPDFDYGSKLN